ncbi:MAG: ATP-binding protein [Synergistaceae bacterium]|nr:ATP-binding protein [Synergistaceae bacterium]
MSDNNAIIKELRENNPFMSSASPLPWNNTTPDLVQLNRVASEEIESLILQKRRQPSVPLAGLILGEPGSGKTHMLTRMLRKLRLHAKLAIFVTVRTFLDPESVRHHLLSEILISLTQFHSANKSQFDMLVNEVLESFREQRLNDGFTDISKIDPKIYMARDMPGIDKRVLKCLSIYSGTTDKNVKWSVLEWLREGLDDEDSHNLGLPVRDVNSMSVPARESEAEKILVSLGLLLAYAKVPMIVCFDQLDAMKDRELIQAWGSVINLLMNDLSGVLPLCFVKFTIWNDILKPNLDPSVYQRLEHHRIIMKECSLDQAKLLIYDRIAASFRDSANEKYNWLISRLGDTLKPGFSPRMVIELANKVIFTDDKPDTTSTSGRKPKLKSESGSGSESESEIFKTIRNVYNEECRKIKAQPSSWPPSAENLTLALSTWLDARENFEVTSENKRGHLKIQGESGGKKYSFFIVTPKVHISAANALKQAIELMNQSPDNECFYVSETKVHKRTWRRTNEILQDFQDNGGHAYILDKDSRIDWYGLAALVNRIDNGDVDLFLDSGHRTATRDDIREFVRSLKLLDTGGGSDVNAGVSKAQTHRTKLSIDPNILGRSLLTILNKSPMRMISINKAMENLSKNSIQISESDLAAFLKANPERFKLFSSKSDMIISLTDNDKKP